MSFAEEKKNRFLKNHLFHIFLAAFTTMKNNLQPNTVTILQSPIAQGFLREDLPRGPREQAVSRVWLGDSWPLPSTHSAQLQGLRSSACLHLCQLKIGLSGDRRHMYKGWLKNSPLLLAHYCE